MVFCFVGLFAQIQEGASSMSKGTENAFSLELRSTNKKDVEKAWEKYIKKFKGKTKYDKKAEECFSDNAELENMSTNTVDVYSKVTPAGENTILTVWFDLGGAFLSSEMHGDKVNAAKNMMNEFALSVSVAQVEEELKEQQKLLKDLEKDQKGLEKDKSNLEDDIKKFEQKIAEAKEAIKQNLEAQKGKQVEIDAQKKVVQAVEDTLKKLK